MRVLLRLPPRPIVGLDLRLERRLKQLRFQPLRLLLNVTNSHKRVSNLEVIVQ